MRSTCPTRVDDRHPDPGGAGAGDEVEVHGVVEEQLRDQEIDAGAHLLGEVFEVGLGARRMDMGLGEARGANRERVVAGDQLDELARVLEAPLGLRPGLLARGRVAAQRKHVVDARVLHLGERFAQLRHGRADAREVRHRLKAILLADPLDDLDRLLPG